MLVKGHKHRRHQPQGNTGTELRDPEDRPLIVGVARARVIIHLQYMRNLLMSGPRWHKKYEQTERLPFLLEARIHC